MIKTTTSLTASQHINTTHLAGSEIAVCVLLEPHDKRFQPFADE
jgi:hypothetical protein